MNTNKSMYPERKARDLTELEKKQIRDYFRKGHSDIYLLAKEFRCSTSQIAGMKAANSRK